MRFIYTELMSLIISANFPRRFPIQLIRINPLNDIFKTVFLIFLRYLNCIFDSRSLFFSSVKAAAHVLISTDEHEGLELCLNRTLCCIKFLLNSWFSRIFSTEGSSKSSKSTGLCRNTLSEATINY